MRRRLFVPIILLVVLVVIAALALLYIPAKQHADQVRDEMVATANAEWDMQETQLFATLRAE